MKFANSLNRGKIVVAALALGLLISSLALGPAAGKDKGAVATGKELFTREWLPGDRRSQAGDGLGPLFNARSCAACHFLGGTGGAGPKHSNVTVVSVFLTQDESRQAKLPIENQPQNPPKLSEQPKRDRLARIHPALRTGNSFPFHRFGSDEGYAKWKFGLSTSTGYWGNNYGGGLGFVGVGLKEGGFGGGSFEANFGGSSAGNFADNFGGAFGGNFGGGFGGLLGGFTGNGLNFNSHELGQSSPFGFSASGRVDGTFVLLVGSQRNPPALFGIGLIDRIPVQMLEEVAASQARTAKKISPPPSSNPSEKGPSFSFGFGPIPDSLPVSGRVARLKDGRAGRFGWKAQMATLREFTLQASAVEIGLEVPGFSKTPWKNDYKAPGLDLSAEQCDVLVKFVGSLPPSPRKPPETKQHTAEIAAGQKLFERAGCAVCHQPKLGDVDGIYSDLLLHDMGKGLSDTFEYPGSIVVGEAGVDGIDPLPVVDRSGQDKARKNPKFGASSWEWRTPPLWGLRDSAPYMHDGRADTISAAIALHGGEGLDSAQQFLRLSLCERQQLELFLQSLGVPDQEPKVGR
jgi:mono/diheme cytochrome c family protein